jgi:hypothetical protein
LIPTASSCRLAVYLGRPEAEEHDTPEIRAMIQGYMELWGGLGPIIERDLAAGQITVPAAQGPRAEGRGRIASG